MGSENVLERIEHELRETKRLVLIASDENLGVAGVSRLMGLSHSAIYQKTARLHGQAPELPHYKQGKRLYFQL